MVGEITSHTSWKNASTRRSIAFVGLPVLWAWAAVSRDQNR